MLRRVAGRMFDHAMDANVANIERELQRLAPGGTLLDLGCDDGELTIRFSRAAKAAETHGIEIVPERARLARERGIVVHDASVAATFPLPDASFDVVVSNQVIEHLSDPDVFLSETKRVLRPGGTAIISTENLASWHNIAALVLGWQPFSLSNASIERLGIGNPLAIHRREEHVGGSWRHLLVFAHRGLVEIVEAHGLTVRSVRGAGYYPFPSRLASVETRHAAFLAVTATS